MHFLPDVWVPCEECQSRRYNEDVLEVKLHGKSIADVLEMQCGEATELFANYPKILRTLQTLCDVGLEYVTLGQSAPTLSGGEAQRVKLAAELSRPMTGSTLYLMDEPTTGLHFDDIEKLLNVMQRLVEMGNSVVVIEHNLDVIKCADWIVDMGPGAGVNGGQVVFTGTPEDLAAQAASKGRKGKNSYPISVTAPFLAEVLANRQQPGGTEATHRSEPQGKQKAVFQSGAGAKESLKAPASKSQQHAAKRGQTQSGEQGARRRPSIARVDPPEDQKPGSDIQASTRKRGTAATVIAEQDCPETQAAVDEAAAVVLEPWKALGKKWHSLDKGFAEGESPEWPLEVAERTVKLLETIAGPGSLVFSAADGFEVKPEGADHVWAEVKTKEISSLKITLEGPESAFDESGFSKLDMQGPVERKENEATTITLELNSLTHVRSRKLRTFLKRHLEQIRG